MAEGSVALEMLNQCHEKQYKLAIDDFGTGFSSMQYLANMPIDDLKIDRSFVRSIHSNPKSLAVVKSIIYLARLLDMRLIAEGIETKEELDFLSNSLVEFGQGFYFSKALPLKEFNLYSQKMVSAPPIVK
jgi:EAL domain-containing protein (putative c-di-GMP-specific phosphodiesterase class I)